MFVCEFTVFQLGFQKGRALLLKRALLSVNVSLKRALYFWIVFTIKLKRNNLCHQLKKYMLKQALISLKYFCPLWVKLLKKIIIILNDRVFYFLSTAIVILIVIVIRINHYDQKMKFPDKTFSNFNHAPKAINSLITQSACVYLDLLPHVKRMLTEI